MAQNPSTLTSQRLVAAMGVTLLQTLPCGKLITFGSFFSRKTMGFSHSSGAVHPMVLQVFWPPPVHPNHQFLDTQLTAP